MKRAILIVFELVIGVIIGGLAKRKYDKYRGGGDCYIVVCGNDRGNNRRDYTQEITDLADKIGVKIGG